MLPPVCHPSPKIEAIALAYLCEHEGYKGSGEGMERVGCGCECDLRIKECYLSVVFGG